MSAAASTCTVCGVPVNGDMSLHTQGKKHMRLAAMKGQNEAKSARTIYVRGFSPSITSEILTDYFGSYGSIKMVHLQKDKGMYAFVEFATAEVASSVMRPGRRHYIQGRHLVVRPKEVKTVTLQTMANKRFANDPPVAASPSIDYDQILKALRASESVAEQITLLQKLLALRPKDLQDRKEIVRNIQAVFEHRILGCKVNQFGSSVNGFGVRGCDMDLFLDLNLDPSGTPAPTPVVGAAPIPPSLRVDDEGPQLRAGLAAATVIQRVNYVYKMLSRSGLKLAHLMKIPASRCPVVQFVDAPTGTSCDLSVNNRLALQNTQLLQLMCRIDMRVCPLIYAMRYFFKSREISGGTSGSQKLSSYALCWMVMTYLQQCDPPVLPSIGRLAELADGGERTITDGWDTSFSRHVDRVPSSSTTTTTPPADIPTSESSNTKTEIPDSENDTAMAVDPPTAETEDIASAGAATQEPTDSDTPDKAPDIAGRKNCATLTELLTGFFSFYSKVTLASTVICPREGKLIPVTEFLQMSKTKPGQEEFKLNFVNIQDPFVLSHNLAQNLNERLGELVTDELQEANAKCTCAQFTAPGTEHDWGLTFLVSKERLTKPLLSSSKGKHQQGTASGYDYIIDVEFRPAVIPRELFNRSRSVEEVKAEWARDVCRLLMKTLEDVLLFSCQVTADRTQPGEDQSPDGINEAVAAKAKKRPSSDSTPDEPNEKKVCAASTAEGNEEDAQTCTNSETNPTDGGEKLDSDQKACTEVSSKEEQCLDDPEAESENRLGGLVGHCVKSLSNTSVSDSSEGTPTTGTSAAESGKTQDGENNKKPDGATSTSSLLLEASCGTVHQSWAGRKRVKKALRASALPIDDTLRSELLVTERLRTELGPSGPHPILQFDLRVLRTTTENGKSVVKIQMKPTLAPKLFNSFYQFFSVFFSKLKENSLFVPTSASRS